MTHREDGSVWAPFSRDAEYSERSANRPIRTEREVRAPLRKAFASRLNGLLPDSSRTERCWG